MNCLKKKQIKYHLKFSPYVLFSLGQSLLPLLESEVSSESRDAIFASHQLHEISMYYPMRVVRTDRYKLILNLNYKSPFPIDMDFAVSPTFQDLLNRTKLHQPLHWFSSLDKYYYRAPFELYDLKQDPKELNNLYNKTGYIGIMKELVIRLHKWQNVTNDPWICAPQGFLDYTGHCQQLLNGIPNPFNHVEL